jgi:GNAT superfamily N-acetyltransferase
MDEIEIVALDSKSWARARAVRLAALTADPDAYGVRADGEAKLSEVQWRERVARDLWVVATLNGSDVAVMSVAPTVPALVEPICPVDPLTCAWAYGCWVSPEMRGQRIPAKFIEFLDHLAPERGWTNLGLGVFVQNLRAKRVYERIGFRVLTDPLESLHRPGTFFQPMFRPVAD